MIWTAGRNSAWPPSTLSGHAWRRTGGPATPSTGAASISASRSPVRRYEAVHRRGHDEYRQCRDYGGRYILAEAIRALVLPLVPPPYRLTAWSTRGRWFGRGGNVSAALGVSASGEASRKEGG
jgi:hypothetical protein